MKIEIGESLIASWLKHIKKCKVVEMNWKPSVLQWDSYNEEELEKLMEVTKEFFYHNYNYDLYKKTSSYEQLILQAEIDVLGINFDDGMQIIYAVEVAYHENGLNYGAKAETISRVIKKLIRTIMCIYRYFDYSEGKIVFASPKINSVLMEPLEEAINDLNIILKENGFGFEVEVIANKEFNNDVLKPLINIANSYSDSNELFMRSIQLLNMFNETNKEYNNRGKGKIIEKTVKRDNTIEDDDEVKVGRLVKETLYELLEWEQVSRDEVERLQDKEYSKKTFNINYPLLLDASGYHKKPSRYYKTKVQCYDSEYFICSEWYKNDREYYLAWLEEWKDKYDAWTNVDYECDGDYFDDFNEFCNRYEDEVS